MPTLYIITGSNGAGKSTVGPEYLPEEIKNNYKVFDGDKLFMEKQAELFPYITKSPKESKKLAQEYVINTFERLVEEALSKNDNFVYEGHFTNDHTWLAPKRFKKAGYQLHLLFLGLSDPDLSQLRVADRVVTTKGHYVDRLKIEANLEGNLEKLNKYSNLINDLTIIDTSEMHHSTIVRIIEGTVYSAVPQSQLPWWFREYMPDIASLIP